MFSEPYAQPTANVALRLRLKAGSARLFELLPGIAMAFMATLGAYILSDIVGGPVMLYAIIVGMTLNPILHKTITEAGIRFSAKKVLNVGVSLLGVKIALVDIAGLGFEAVALVLLCASGTILTGIGVGRLLGLKSDHAVLSSGAVAICGVSAAMALCAALPQNKESERNTLITVMGVTLLGTVVMVAYPAISHFMGLSETQAGIFIGATIHNVAQVVGAGFMISETAGDTATIVKLMRVACLVPVIAIVTLTYSRNTKQPPKQAEANVCTRTRPPLVPSFLIGFVALVAMSSLGLIPSALSAVLSDLSGYALVMAIAALGVKTSLRDLFGVGGSTFLILVVQTVLLGGFVLAVVILTPFFA